MAYENTQNAGEMTWDGVIQKESNFFLLPEGEYDFRVKSFERARHEQKDGQKIPTCPMARVFFEVVCADAPDGVVELREEFKLHSSVEWLICAFYTSIGMRKKGEAVRMNWPATIGKYGRFVVGFREYTKDGEERKVNQIKKYLEPPEAPAQTTAQQPIGYQPGRF
jgi:hypothetical protein